MTPRPKISERLEARLAGEDLEALPAAPLSRDEVAEVRALVEWFGRRYPTAKDRFAYVRRAYARWTGSAKTTER